VPIANCFLRGEHPAEADVDRLIALWSEESDVGPEEMTINLIAGARQGGSSYRLMALLFLPSLWSRDAVDRLQRGLAAALSRGLGLSPSDVHVITSIVDSGHVVENGQTQEWQ
jgi:hypothetical protein